MPYTKAEKMIVLEQEVAESHALLKKARALLIKLSETSGHVALNTVGDVRKQAAFIKAREQARTLINEIPENL